MQTKTDITSLTTGDYYNLLAKQSSKLWKAAWILSAIDLFSRFMPRVATLKVAGSISSPRLWHSSKNRNESYETDHRDSDRGRQL